MAIGKEDRGRIILPPMLLQEMGEERNVNNEITIINMAGYSDGDFLKEMTNIQRLIHEFPNDQQGSGMSPHIDKFLEDSMKRTRNIESCEKLVEQLKMEIESLESELDSQNESLLGFSNTELDAIQEMFKVVEDKHGFRPVNVQLKPHDNSLMASLTGIHFDDFTRKSIGQEDGSIIIRQHLQGHCYNQEFDVVFDVAEVQSITRIPGHASTTSETEIIVTQLKIKVDPKIEEHLKKFIEKCESRQNLQPFFQTYSQYAEWYDHRQRTYEHFKEAFDKEISLPNGSTGSLLQFTLPGQTRIVFLLSWDIHIDEEDKVHQVIDLVPKASSTVYDVDENDILKSLPEKFLLMVKTLGMEHALSTLFKSVCEQ
ncbi:centromere protein P-like [Antedon mediterranea]|uniref:centromere protein P-like n=1 Tax=Antedon mediterranea TaxID=105859 RepID=UPI003AF77C05